MDIARLSHELNKLAEGAISAQRESFFLSGGMMPRSLHLQGKKDGYRAAGTLAINDAVVIQMNLSTNADGVPDAAYFADEEILMRLTRGEELDFVKELGEMIKYAEAQNDSPEYWRGRLEALNYVLALSKMPE